MKLPNFCAKFVDQYLRAADMVCGELGAHGVGYTKGQLSRYKVLINLIYPNILNKRCLDVGVYPGIFSYSPLKMGIDIEAVDIAPTRIPPSITQNLHVYQADIEQEKIPVPDASYEVVLFLAVIEHLRINPLQVLREFDRILVPGGRLIVQTPNLGFWFTRLKVLFGRSFDESPTQAYRRLEELGHPGHVRVYTMHELIEIMEYCGFQIEQKATFNNEELDGFTSKKSIANRLFGFIPSTKRQLLVIGNKKHS